jgi:hypothetical protein
MIRPVKDLPKGNNAPAACRSMPLALLAPSHRSETGGQAAGADVQAIKRLWPGHSHFLCCRLQLKATE